MPRTATYRYQLQPYRGRNTRYTCPDCQKPHCFTRYLDTATGELLDATYGWCDHEISCGYHRSPRRDKPPTGWVSPSTTWPATTRQPTEASPPTWRTPPTGCTIPATVLDASVQLDHYRRNALATWLQSLFGLGEADKLLRRFQLGTSAYWPGACIFWLIDEQGHIRGGQVVLYDETGHTVKTGYRHTRWVHTALTTHYQRLGLSVPAWLVDYNANSPKSPCLFGLPQLAAAPAGQPVALVESAKTAMIASYYLPNFIWLATMGLSYLTEERLRPLKGRKIRLYPDAGAFEKWSQKAAGLRRMGYQVEVSDLLEKVVTPIGRQAGLDVADVLLHEHPGYPPSWDERD
ncbi:MAG: DUF6371 domain-containing protein [Janthinobacterium lividum]